ncbi:MAG: ATP-grasp domain-containing protein [Pseudonocardiaceae bacterium]
MVLHYPDVQHANWELLCKAAQSHAIRFTTWEPHRLQIQCMGGKISGCYDGKRVRPRIVLHRTVAAFQGIVIPALELWESEGASVLNEPTAAYRSRDKLLTYLALHRAQVSIVDTIAFTEPSTAAMQHLTDHQGVILKPAHGIRGAGIQVFGSTGELVAAWENDVVPQSVAREHYVVQPLIKGGGRDVRAFVVNGACVALMQRQAAPGEARANLALGATPTQLSLDHPAASTAVAALAACQLDYGGVDLIEDDDGTVRVLEVDAWAGFAGISAVTGEDVASAILQLAIQRRPGVTAT